MFRRTALLAVLLILIAPLARAGRIQNLDGGGVIDSLMLTCAEGEGPEIVAGVPACSDDSTGSGSLGANLASTTTDITSDTSIIILAGVSESITLTFTANTATFTSTTGVATIAFPGTVTAATMFSGPGTSLTALNGENVQDDTIDDDSLDFGTGADQISGADLPLTDAGAITAAGKITANASLDVAFGATSSGIIKILEDTDAGANFATIQVPALAANTVYTLPADDGDAGEQLQTDGAGVMTWEAAGSFNSTAIDATTWSDNANASNIWTFDVSGTDHTMTAGNGLMTFGDSVTVTDVFTVAGTGTHDFGGPVTGTRFVSDDATAEPGNLMSVNDNDTAFANDPTCANSGSAGTLTILDTDEGAGEDWKICDGTSDLFDFNTEVRSMYWGAAGMSSDGSACATPAEVTINSGPKLYTAICTDSDSSTLYGSSVMPDAWDGGTVTFELTYIQTAANTGAMNSDIACQCRGNGEVPSSTWGSETAIDDAEVVGSNANDQTTSSATTCAGTCAAGDVLYWRWQLDAMGTTTTAASLNMVGVKMEYTSAISD